MIRTRSMCNRATPGLSLELFSEWNRALSGPVPADRSNVVSGENQHAVDVNLQVAFVAAVDQDVKRCADRPVDGGVGRVDFRRAIVRLRHDVEVGPRIEMNECGFGDGVGVAGVSRVRNADVQVDDVRVAVGHHLDHCFENERIRDRDRALRQPVDLLGLGRGAESEEDRAAPVVDLRHFDRRRADHRLDDRGVAAVAVDVDLVVRLHVEIDRHLRVGRRRVAASRPQKEIAVAAHQRRHRSAVVGAVVPPDGRTFQDHHARAFRDLVLPVGAERHLVARGRGVLHAKHSRAAVVELIELSGGARRIKHQALLVAVADQNCVSHFASLVNCRIGAGADALSESRFLPALGSGCSLALPADLDSASTINPSRLHDSTQPASTSASSITLPAETFRRTTPPSPSTTSIVAVFVSLSSMATPLMPSLCGARANRERSRKCPS